ncbi:cytochrome c-type biogenesis protein CcmF [Rhodobium orientis]|uniref:Heme lyase NrfEFG subunit NrfE n=1 Tax=Rhodobium orientis TaxID=34017 RepID=A0A327JFZ0_9HYPH|nr:heme lyase CcmF/NrfE family subunit [Rhodobium orientis]MBB4305054.1 cytochrome c-type biogenesis protein CcmF [Rhodobium orientis]MBK5949894.1 heme lyase NrfEFG subunit NrfE [Rhodobium orientis]RAI24851.1 heme lyase NrfEFG subunit NrfE [Rhodobium orientis]
MIAELGHYALVLAFALSLIQSVLPIWGSQRGDPRLMAVASPAAAAQFLFVGLAFAALTQAFVQSDFSLELVWANSHSTQPLIYKFTSVWGNHEGSMLLWALILAFFGALVAAFGHNMPATLKANVLAVQGWIAAAFLLFILTTSNPFARIFPAPMEGQDLNPILQDIGLAVHPPLLYLGYVGFSIAFAFAAASLIEGRIDAAWARWVRPWVLIAWIFLTLGIAMGSYWAYYELGWGGWWFWDPVENASFMPWLTGSALLHSAIVMEKRDALKVWTILLAILTFSLSLLGTFLVRSGVLTSVHSFASDPTRGVFILLILATFIGGAFALFAWRAPSLRRGGLFAPISREGALVFNNLFLTAACAAVLIGTLYPLALEATTGEKISVGAPFFNMTFGPLILPALIVMPFGPFLAWKRGDILAVAQRLAVVLGLVILTALITAWAMDGGPLLAILGIALAAWMMIGAIADIASRIKLFRVPAGNSLRRAVGLPRSAWGTAFAHFGVGVTVLGIVTTSAWQLENIRVMKEGETATIGGYEATFLGSEGRAGPNYREIAARFRIARDGRELGVMTPSKRVYTARGMPTSEAAIRSIGFSQIYLAIGDEMNAGGVAVRLYWKPLVLLVWLGCVVMAFGGLLSLSDRRLRVGAPTRARRTVAAAE